MKIVVFGASGGTGIEILIATLEAGHDVTGFGRSPEKIQLKHPNLSLVQGDVLDAAAVDKAVAGQEAVISALGPTRPPVPNLMENAIKNIAAAMEGHAVRRLIMTSGAGVSDPEDKPKIIDRLVKSLLSLMAGDVLRDSEAGVNYIRGTDLDWTIVRVPRLVDGPGTGKYRVGMVGKNSGMMISRADCADFIVKELGEGKYIRQAPMVSQ